jgi:hypothetical protein
MDTSLIVPNSIVNQIVFRNPTFTIEAYGKSADRISDAATFALCCLGIAAIIKALR